MFARAFGLARMDGPGFPLPSPACVTPRGHAVGVTAGPLIYTAASWLPAEDLGGWAWVVPDGPWAAGRAAGTTSNRLQLQAVREALLLRYGGQLEVVTVAYVVDCFEQEWWVAWERSDWRTVRNKPVRNRDLLEPLIQQVREHGVTFRKPDRASDDPWIGEAARWATVLAGRERLPCPAAAARPGEPAGGYVVYRLDFSGGQHYIGYTNDLGRRLKEHRKGDNADLQHLLREEIPKKTALYRCSLRPLAEYYEELAIDAAMEAPTRRDLLNTITP